LQELKPQSCLATVAKEKQTGYNDFEVDDGSWKEKWARTIITRATPRASNGQYETIKVH
jgi:hypothetical protein